MKKIFTLILISTLMMQININAQDKSYQKEWQTVQSFDNKGLPKSALKEVEKIYQRAKADNNKPQIIKSIIYELKYMQSLKDEGDQKVIDKINAEIASSDFPTKNILYSIKAEAFQVYYNRYSYKIFSRSNTLNFESDDIATLSLNQIIAEIIKNYNLSLKNADKLLSIDKKEFDAIIRKGKNSEGILPTLYDFLAYRAIQYFKLSDFRISKSVVFFQLNDAKYFSQADEFANLNISSSDSLSAHYQAIKLFQKWLKLHSKDANKKSKTHIDLLRLHFVHDNAVNADKDILYLEALKKLQAKNENTEEYAEISYYIAKYYSDKSELYKPDNKLTAKYKDYNKTALQICESTIKKYPKSFGAKMCKNLKSHILYIHLNFQVESIIAPKSNFPILVEYRNNKKVYTMVGKIDLETFDKLTGKYSGPKLLANLKKAVQNVQKSNAELKGVDDHNQHTAELIIKGLDIGNYVIFLSNNPDFTCKKNTVSYELITVSNLAYIHKTLDDGKAEFCVLNRTTGKPIEGVSIKAWKSSYNYKKRKHIKSLFGQYKTDKNGIFYIETSNNRRESLSLDLFYGNDYLKSRRNASVYRHNTAQNTEAEVYLYTDRAIYRPGQTLYFKGVVLDSNGEKHELIKNKQVEVELYDVNYKLVEKKLLKTNEYGSFSGSYVLPSHLLNGKMNIKCLNYRKYISVEEYKRPKFSAEILPVKGNYILNDLVNIKGKATAYSGAMITGAKVKYRIVRKPVWRGWWHCFLPQTETQIAEGVAKTNEKGEFEISFKAVPDLNYEKSPYLMFNYIITADVSDLNGETQSVKKHIKVGYRALEMSVKLEERTNKEHIDSLEITTQNVNGEFLAAKGELKIFSLKKLDKALRSRVWHSPDEFLYTKSEWKKLYKGNEYKDENDIKQREKDKLIFTSKFDTKVSNKIKLEKAKSWKSGIYVAELSSVDAFGNKIEYKKYFTLYSSKDNIIPDEIIDWVVPIKITCEPGEKAQFLVGSSISGLNIFYEIEHKRKIVKKEQIITTGNQQLIEIPVIEDYRGNFSVHFTFLYNNRVYNTTTVVTVPYTNKHLDITFATFRDKLLPGSEEEWKIKITGHNKDKVAAEMLASMYDASLDQFAKDNWQFNIYQSYYSSLMWKSNIYSVNHANNIFVDLNPFVAMPFRNLSSLNWFGTYLFQGEIFITGYARNKSIKLRGAASMADDKSLPPMMEAAAGVERKEVSSNLAEDESEKKAKVDEDGIQDKPMGDVKIRSNFNETAFFYPNLQTNSKGELIIKFKIPESLTTWKMRGFAYTKDLEFGFVEKQLKTQKDLMVMPNSPRFFRQNDEIEFPVKISNLSENKQVGSARLELFDAITMKPITNIYAKSNDKDKEFKINGKSNTVVTWKLKIPEINGAIMYKVSAKSGDFSDGEQMLVPLLTNRMLVTESLPLPIKGAETKTFKLDKLLKSKKSQSLKNFKLTLEFSSNPAWYAVQALPYIMENESECSMQLFSRYYANSIANYVANSSPKIKRVFDSWKNDTDSKALLSNLDKNSELKSALQEETPWVLQAENEQERKKRISLLFDFNKMSGELQKASSKLKQSQTSNGGWAWFKGMPESRYITQYIVGGFGHLNHLSVYKNIEQSDIWSMLNRAVLFLDREFTEDYKKLKRRTSKKDLEKDNLSNIAINYLYVRSFFKNIKANSNTQKAIDYYMNQSEKYWLSRNLYSKGMIALYLNRNGKIKTAQSIVKSLKEFSITHDELGMYWKENTAGYFWYQRPIETQALMIEAFNEIGKYSKDVESLKVWLLKQKQTQDWKTSKATTEAIYALLMNGSEWLENENLVDIRIGEQSINPNKIDGVKAEAGTGYFKTSWQASDIKPEMGKVKLHKKDKGVAWGALYWQYFEDLDKITAHKTPLKMNKKLFVERISKSGKEIEPVTKKTKLEIGDKIIVRLEIRTDRNMEYVHLKDMRASGFEPINVISKYKYKGGLGYYESTKDISSNFFISYLRKGTYVFEYPLRVSHKGDFSNGISTIQCMYAPEFASHSEGIRVKVK